MGAIIWKYCSPSPSVSSARVYYSPFLRCWLRDQAPTSMRLHRFHPIIPVVSSLSITVDGESKRIKV